MQRFLRIVVVMLLFAAALFYPLLAPTAHRIDAAHFELIKEGMTEADVEAIFGVAAGEYDWARANDRSMLLLYMLAIEQAYATQETRAQSAPQQELRLRLGLSALGPRREMKKWVGRQGAFHVSFDQHGRVAGTHSLGSTEIEYPWKRWWQKVTAR